MTENISFIDWFNTNNVFMEPVEGNKLQEFL